MSFSADEITELFSDADDAIWERAVEDGGPVPFKAYFDNKKIDPSSQGVNYSGHEIIFTCPTNPPEKNAKDQIISIGGTRYEVLRHYNDGNGITELTVQEA